MTDYVSYNVDFLYASLMILLLLLFHYLCWGRKRAGGNRFFQLNFFLAMTDVSLDILTSILIDAGNLQLFAVSEQLLTILLILYMLLQLTFPTGLLLYSLYVWRTGERIRRVTGWIVGVQAFCMGLLILTAPLHRQLFSFDGTGAYHRGPLMTAAYLYAVLYVLLPAVLSLARRKQFPQKHWLLLWGYTLVSMTCVALQIMLSSEKIMLSGFGITLGVVLLYLTISNPNRHDDYMTGAFHVRRFSEWIEQELRRKRVHFIVTVHHIHLRNINKVYGVAVGNDLLQHTVQYLKQQICTDHVYRISGSQFAAVTDGENVYRQVLRDVREHFLHPIAIGEDLIECRPVVAGLTVNEEFTDGNAVLSYCHYLTSLTEDRVGSRLVEDQPELRDGFFYEQRVERFLQQAIEKDLFEIYLQPVYSVREDRYTSAECLSRLWHPQLGMISPEMFVRIAEQNGTIDKITILQFRRLCRFLKSHPDLLDLLDNVKFNLSPHDLLAHRNAEVLLKVIRRFELPVEFFQFEITETAATEFAGDLQQILQPIIHSGIGICMDDFGSGYANLNAVLRLPFSVIKLDRSLLQGICGSSEAAVFYKSIADALQNMGYRLVAEGVEEQAELELLRQWGVDMIQGYYFSRPLPEKDFLKLITG